MRTALFLAALPVMGLFAPAVHADEFTLEDLKALVAEFETVVPHNPNYTYPIEVTIKEDDEINAAAGVRPDGDKLQATLEANTGFIAAVDGDPAMMRAVIAHEMAHLALGHAIDGSLFTDFDQLMTRQEEFAADAAGAGYLEALGYDRSEMVDLLHFLDGTQARGFPIWLQTAASDHASPVTRAGLIAGDNQVLEALSHLEVGLAFMECRRYEEAILWFEDALRIEPRMTEAYVNIALASLQDYYERLPIKVQEEWLRPAFIPHLTTTSLIGGRAVEITDKDLARYQRVLERINDIPEGQYFISTTFLRGTLEVLHPSGDAKVIQAGIDRLGTIKLLFPDVMPREVQADQLRLANNIAVGLQRLGRASEAQKVLIGQSLRTAEVFVRAAAENIGRLPVSGLGKDEALQAINITATYLLNTPENAPNFSVVRQTLENILKASGRELTKPLAPAAIYLCQAISMNVDGKDLPLFDPVESYLPKLGDPSSAGFLLEKYPDLSCVIWGDEDVVLLTERGQVLKITSYKPGSSITLKPQNSGSRTGYAITIGMAVSELDKLLEVTDKQSASIETMLLGRSIFRENAPAETWRYYPALNFGVLIEDGKIIGLSVTPVRA